MNHAYNAVGACAECINIEACLALVQLRKQLDDAEEAAIKNKSKKKSKKDEGGIFQCPVWEIKSPSRA